MDSNLKKEIKEIIEIVKECPENLQLRAFEILLSDCLEKKGSKSDKQDQGKGKENGDVSSSKKEKVGFENFQLPMRVKAFLKKQNLEPKDLDELFHTEGQEIERIWTLDTTNFSKAQIQVALLTSLENALTSGEFIFQMEDVREICRQKQAYDKANFMKNFKGSNKKYFGTIDSENPIQLSDEGMNKLADYIRDKKS